jgi:hypothetical protein
VLCDFCDGDERDTKQWLEGHYSQSLTVWELIEHKRDTIRAKRRASSDNLLRKAHLRPRFCKRKDVKQPHEKTSAEDGDEKGESKEEGVSEEERPLSPGESLRNLEEAKRGFR